MKKLLFGVITFLWLGTAVAAPPKTVVLEVNNMTCPSCRITVDAALRRVSGVIDSKVDTASGTVTVRFDPDKTNVDAVEDAVSNAGFPAKARSRGA
jgi:periplasmic mercuric ion binding protein